MYESSGSLTDKIVETGSGNVHHDMGLFDQCLAAVDPRRESDMSVAFQAKYCTVFFDDYQEMDMPVSNLEDDSVAALNESVVRLFNEGEPVENVSNFVKSSVSFCIPSTCSARELRSAVARRVRDFSLVAITNEDYCYTQEKIRDDGKFDTGAIVTRSTFFQIKLFSSVVSFCFSFQQFRYWWVDSAHNHGYNSRIVL